MNRATPLGVDHAQARDHGTAPRLHRRTLLAAALAVPVVPALAACGDSGDDKTTIEFFWWGGEARAALTEQVLDLYESKHPDIKINRTWQAYAGYYDKLATISAGGNAPDIFQIDDNALAEYASRNVTLDLSEYTSSGKIDTTKHPAGLTSYGQVDGKQVAIAAAENTPAMMYDKTKVEELGVEEPETGWDYPKFLEWAKEVSDKAEGDYWGTMDASSDYKALWLYLRGQGKEFYNGTQLAFTQEDLVAWFQMWDDARKSGAASPAEISHEAVAGSIDTQLVVSGKAATSFLWSNQATETGKATTNKLGMVTYPGKPEAAWARASLFWAGSRASDHPDIVADIINFLVNDPEAAAILSTERGLPTNLDNRSAMEATLTDEYAKQTFKFENDMAEVFGEAPPPPPKGHATVREELVKAAEALAYGTDGITPQAAAEQFFTAANSALSS